MEADRSNSPPKDVWALGQAYEPYVGRWSRLVAREFLTRLPVPPGGRWLDVGCGTGALTGAILDTAAPQSVKGIDAAEGFIDFARAAITDPRATFQRGDAQALPVEDSTCDAVVSGFVVNFVPQPERMVAEMARAARPGGVVGLYVWDYADRMQFMRYFWNAAAVIDPAAAALDEGNRFPLCHPGPLADLFQEAGITQVEVDPIDIWTVFKDFDDFWRPFLGGQGPAPSYVMALDEEKRTALRERLQSALPTALDHSIPLMARAWAVRGVR